MGKAKVPATIATILVLSVVVGLLWNVRDTASVSAGQILTVAVPRSLDDYQFSGQWRNQWVLPGKLMEVSGVAITDDDRILMHNDETAVIYAMEISSQEVSVHAQFGNPALAVDIEGIAVIRDDLYLVTSTGMIYGIPDGVLHGGIHTEFDVFDSGLEAICEVEGLDRDFEDRSLVLACKQMYDRDDYISVYRYRLDQRRLEKMFDLPFSEVAGEQRIRPSGITIFHDGYLLLAGKQKLLIQVSRQGQLISQGKLKKKHHRQAEGIGLLGDHTLIVADEGKDRKATIAAYRPASH